MEKPIYKRILIKLSGEALQSDGSLGIDVNKLNQISKEIKEIVKLGLQVAIVVGGGNLIRGTDYCLSGMDRVTADQMGMLATMMNGLALRDAFNQQSLSTKIMSAIAVPGLVDFFDVSHAKEALQQGDIIILAGGTGNPLVTTDSAAALRGIEINADIILKATKVDGVFSADPIKNPTAKRYTSLTYDHVLTERLGVMDLNAILLCRDHQMPLRVFNMNISGALYQIMMGKELGTLIQNGE